VAAGEVVIGQQQERLLHGVSRTFALTIPEFPRRSV
jgi:hypothetical protein